MPPKSRKLEVRPVEIDEDALKKAIEETEEAIETPLTVEKQPEEDKIEEKLPENSPEEDIQEALTAILDVQRGKRAVPSLITFFSVRSNAYRHVIVDVTDSLVEDSWAKYLALAGQKADEEDFMALLYKILNTDVPRMYRAVAPVTLKR